MDNTTCKWVAIVGIILAVLVVLWILAAIIRCCCLGVACVEAICCCCSCCSCCCNNGNSRGLKNNQPTDPFNPGYPAAQPMTFHNHQHFGGSNSPPQYGQVTDLHDESVKSGYPVDPGYNTAPAPGFMGSQHTGYQKLDGSQGMEMNHMGNNTAYNPSYSNSYDNTYDHDTMAHAPVGSNAGYFQNRF